MNTGKGPNIQLVMRSMTIQLFIFEPRTNKTTIILAAEHTVSGAKRMTIPDDSKCGAHCSSFFLFLKLISFKLATFLLPCQESNRL